MGPAEIRVAVAYCAPGCEDITELVLPPGSTVGAAVERAGVLARHPELQARPLDAGVWGRSAPVGQVLVDGDRVEIYRPLTVDPKEARGVRAAVRRRRKQA
jgi:putative ubiquitin-RnfH superfamily antitoxin RatB of RatAB toxin-antitoxin module